MRSIRRAAQAITGFIILTATAAGSEIPRMINYQAQLMDSSGVAISQEGVAMEFRLFQVAAGGLAVWQEGPVAVDVVDGVLSYALGSTAPLPDSLFTRSAEMWLELVVDGEVLNPRTQLLASAYAFRVSTIDSASGGAISGEVVVSGTSAGNQLQVTNSGNGRAGAFQIAGVANSSPALQAQTNGTGPAATLFHESGGVAASCVGDLSIADLAFSEKARILPSAGFSNGSRMLMFSNGGDTTLNFDGGLGQLFLRNAAASSEIGILAGTALTPAYMYLSFGGTQGILMETNETSDGGARITLNQRNPARLGVVIDGQDGSIAEGGKITVYNHSEVATLVLDGDDGSAGGRVVLYDNGGIPTVILDADNAGDGRVTTEVLEITGGADLSEQFDISPGSAGYIEPGMVLSIDPAHVGHLRVSERAYDPTVAGIVSGAGGVKTGMLMGQSGSVADGQFAVALTGRVWCKVDASYGAVQPGDLLTTSDTPGHAMKALASDRMQGAVIGKAMSSLESGTGLVLVLVSLQ